MNNHLCIIIATTVGFISSAYSHTLTLDEAVKKARSNSLSIRAASSSSDSARLKADSMASSRFPRLSLDGSYRNQSIVPEASIGPSKIKLSDNINYSVGPTLSWTIWDSGQKSNLEKSAAAMAELKLSQEKLTEKQIAFNTKVSYVQSVLSYEIKENSEKVLGLSQIQNKDIANRFKTGSASKLDFLSSQSEISNYQLKSTQAISEFENYMEDLKYFTGESIGDLKLETLSDLIARFKSAGENQSASLENHPQVIIQNAAQKSALAQAEAQKSLNWPTINLQLRSSLDYPNGPTLEQINQNSASISLTWSIFEFGSTKKAIAAYEADAKSAELLRADAAKLLLKDLEKAELKVKSLISQIEEATRLRDQQKELSKLNYETYKIGKLGFSDIQSANIRLLDAENRLSSLRAQYLIQIFSIQFLTEGGQNE
jgi:outer membrane protein TolC